MTIASIVLVAENVGAGRTWGGASIGPGGFLEVWSALPPIGLKALWRALWRRRIGVARESLLLAPESFSRLDVSRGEPASVARGKRVERSLANAAYLLDSTLAFSFL